MILLMLLMMLMKFFWFLHHYFENKNRTTPPVLILVARIECAVENRDDFYIFQNIHLDDAADDDAVSLCLPCSWKGKNKTNNYPLMRVESGANIALPFLLLFEKLFLVFTLVMLLMMLFCWCSCKKNCCVFSFEVVYREDTGWEPGEVLKFKLPCLMSLKSHTLNLKHV